MKYLKSIHNFLNENAPLGNLSNKNTSDSMSYGQLERCMDYAKMIRERIEAGQKLDPWMHSQIAVAENELNSVHDALDAEDGVVESKEKPGPDPYKTGLDDDEAEDKETQMKKQAKMDDDDPKAYKEMPGDKKARKEGKVKTSKHVKSYHELYGDDKKNEAVTESEKVYIDFLNKDKKFKQDRKYFKSWDDAVKWGRKTFDKFSTDMINYESLQLSKSVMSDLHQMAGEVKDESIIAESSMITATGVSGTEIKHLRTISSYVEVRGPGVYILANDDNKKEILDYLKKIKAEISESLTEETENGYMLRIMTGAGGDEADIFLNNNKVSLDKIKRALNTNKFTKYDLKDVIQGKAAASIEKKVMREISEAYYSEPLDEAYSIISATGVSNSEFNFLKTLSIDIQKQGPGVYIAVNDDNKQKVLDYLKKIKAEVSESLTEEDKKQSTDRTPLEDEAMETGLKKKADETGVPIGIIRAVARRGLAAWKSGHRPGATQQQWAYSRVNSFLTKQPGTWGGADSDLAKEVRDGGHDKKLKKA